jgi:hypothetical protein
LWRCIHTFCTVAIHPVWLGWAYYPPPSEKVWLFPPPGEKIPPPLAKFRCDSSLRPLGCGCHEVAEHAPENWYGFGGTKTLPLGDFAYLSLLCSPFQTHPEIAETTAQRPDCSATSSCASCPGLSNAKPRLVILTAGAVVNLAQGRNAASLGVIQGGSGIPIGACP